MDILQYLQIENKLLREALDVCLWRTNIDHVYMGACPDLLQPNERDIECPACRVLLALESFQEEKEQRF